MLDQNPKTLNIVVRTEANSDKKMPLDREENTKQVHIISPRRLTDVDVERRVKELEDTVRSQRKFWA